ncbi:hypothetical protein AALP_AAs56071U000100, partial [Arabis alpina]
FEWKFLIEWLRKAWRAKEVEAKDVNFSLGNQTEQSKQNMFKHPNYGTTVCGQLRLKIL